MIKRDITETVYEYDNEGKLVKKTVVEKHEEETDTVYPSSTTSNKPNTTYPSTNTTPYITWTTDSSISSTKVASNALNSISGVYSCADTLTGSSCADGLTSACSCADTVEATKATLSCCDTALEASSISSIATI